MSFITKDDKDNPWGDDPLDRIKALEERLREVEEAARDLLANCDQDSAPAACERLERILDGQGK